MATSSPNPSLVPDAQGFIDLSPRISQISVLNSNLKNLLPIKINVDPTYEIQQIKLDSYEIYDMANISNIISQNNIVSDTCKARFIQLTGFPNAQEIYRKGVILEDIKINPTLDYEDLKIIRQLSENIISTISPLAVQIQTLEIESSAGKKIITKDNMGDVIDIEYTEELKQIVKLVDDLKTKYNETTVWISFNVIENLPTTPGGLAVNPYRGVGSSTSIRFTDMPQPGNSEFASLISTIGTTNT